MKHSQKIKMARKMRTPQEEKDRVSIFDTIEWNRRKSIIMDKEKKKCSR